MISRYLIANKIMTDINSVVNNPSSPPRRRAGVQRMVKHHLKIDMTPMVDLGFLLIAFFVVTTELTQPTAMDLYMPKDGGDPPNLAESKAITILLDNDNSIYYYNGKWEDALQKREIYQTGFSGTKGLRKIINDKQIRLETDSKNKEGRDGLMILIKPSGNASYKNVVDVLDEMTISMVKKYAVIKISDAEKTWLKENNKAH